MEGTTFVHHRFTSLEDEDEDNADVSRVEENFKFGTDIRVAVTFCRDMILYQRRRWPTSGVTIALLLLRRTTGSAAVATFPPLSLTPQLGSTNSKD